jgi:pimeloyl-ACP methyl ester carboxylesterase
VDARLKEHELYATSEPPAGWGLETEVEAIRRFVDEAGFEQFNLVGYSGGGAIAIAFWATYPERLASLALNEPAWTGITRPCRRTSKSCGTNSSGSWRCRRSK